MRAMFVVLLSLLPAFASAQALSPDDPATARPAGLTALHISYASLQAFDTITTLTALNAGNVEANPMMTGVTSRPVAFVAAKAGATALSIYVAERLVKQRHKKAAMVVMLASNAFLTGIAVNNVRHLR